MKTVRYIWQALQRVTLTGWVSALAAAWLWQAAALVAFHRGEYGLVNFAQELSWWLVGGVIVFGALVLVAAAAWRPQWKVPSRALVGGGWMLAFWLAYRADSSSRMYLFLALAAFTAVLVYYAEIRGLLSVRWLRPARWSVWTVCAVLFLAMAGALAVLGCLRYRCYIAPNFDFGIFCQMFHNMKETGLPLTTCERNQLMSHFAVHVSPVYYLMLPAYMLFPSPYTLAVGQAVVVASGVFPLLLICRRYGLSAKVSVAMTLAYAAYPALSAGCLYDLHENCFLAPLLLLLFCAYEYKKTFPMVAAALLVLSVKEDAAAAVAIFALYVLFSRRDVKRGLLLFSMAVLWFGVALWLLDTYGEGGMIGRYADYQYGGGGLLSIVKTLAVNPGLFLRRVLSATAEKPAEKLWYLLQLALPLAPLLCGTRRLSRFILLLPVAVNLLSNWPYQYNVTFQYSFGVSAFFLYLCVMNAAEQKPAERRAGATFAVLTAVMLYVMVFWPSVTASVQRCKNNAETCRTLDAVLETIPDEASVTCSTFLLPHLADRAVVYEDVYHKEMDADYFVVDLRPGYRNGKHEELLANYRAAGYRDVEVKENVIAVLRKP
ncbi:MAG: DUF2079 domain-containing protein [Ruminococcaceae bacterium]|nr:DUF2079 domain-containing protein [Oscillospiraceae bacterium]